jgi:hypothetical protein
MLTDLVNRADAGMIQRRGRPRFPPKSLERLLVAGDVIGRNLSATNRPSWVSSALYTTPMPPPPSFSTTW